MLVSVKRFNQNLINFVRFNWSYCIVPKRDRPKNFTTDIGISRYNRRSNERRVVYIYVCAHAIYSLSQMLLWILIKLFFTKLSFFLFSPVGLMVVVFIFLLDLIQQYDMMNIYSIKFTIKMSNFKTSELNLIYIVRR